MRQGKSNAPQYAAVDTDDTGIVEPALLRDADVTATPHEDEEVEGSLGMAVAVAASRLSGGAGSGLGTYGRSASRDDGGGNGDRGLDHGSAHAGGHRFGGGINGEDERIETLRALRDSLDAAAAPTAGGAVGSKARSRGADGNMATGDSSSSSSSSSSSTTT